MNELLIAYFGTLIAFLAIDFVWLKYLAKNYYYSKLSDHLRERPLLGTAAAFYLIYVLGIVVFAVSPGLAAESAWVAAAYGALFGLCAYATYDVTNYATLRNWPLDLSIVDTLWGTGLTASAAFLGYQTVQLF